ncbi:dimethyladenosine transferase 1, mitochondrial [Bacillus rossius redtenbacheri]|uniref:dimethyladenosine transferase 1, mitochondrial n=1 Tax=Bacillus rossius redtenbacheri TaxID=93214 RepID=UPI002FDD2C99
MSSRLRLPPLPSIRDLIRLYRLRALRQLSQNFLMDQRLIDKIVRAAGRIKDGHVCEVGPGPGGITRAILGRNPEKVVVIEKDRRFIPMLELLTEATDGKMDVIIGDVLSFNMEKMFPEEMRLDWESHTPNIHLIGNLPFSVSTPLIIRWLHAIADKGNAWSYGRVPMTLTFQKEVAERMTAPVTSPQRCRLSVMCQNWCNVQHVFTIPGSAFVPKPDVDVGVVHFEPKIEPIIPLPFTMVEKVVRCIFSFRQKYSIRGAETLFPVVLRESLGLEMYRLADVDPRARPFQLTVGEFGRLCSAYESICLRDPRLFRYNSRSSKKDSFDEEGQLEEGQPLETQGVSSVL